MLTLINVVVIGYLGYINYKLNKKRDEVDDNKLYINFREDFTNRLRLFKNLKDVNSNRRILRAVDINYLKTLEKHNTMAITPIEQIELTNLITEYLSKTDDNEREIMLLEIGTYFRPIR